MKERAFTFGTNQILMGILTEPTEARAGAPAVVISNVGLHPRAGAHRAWVGISRALAKLGFTTLRFDINGLGDSEMRRDSRNELERAVVDLGEAFDFMQAKRGFNRFVLIGMCSGVDPVHRVAAVDGRVVGAIFLDGYTYETPRSKFRWKVGRHFTKDGFLRTLRRQLPRTDADTVSESAQIFVREYPEVTVFAADLEHMLSRGTKLLFIYTGGLWMYFNYREQFFDMLAPKRFEGRVDVELRPEADHTYLLPAERARMIERVSGWISNAFAATQG